MHISLLAEKQALKLATQAEIFAVCILVGIIDAGMYSSLVCVCVCESYNCDN